MNEVVVTGIGLISVLGINLKDSWEQLIQGNSGIHLHQPFLELKPRPLGLISTQPTELHTLTPQVVKSALEDAVLKPPLPECGVVIGSSRAYQASWEKMAREFDQASDSKGELFPQAAIARNNTWLDNLPHMNAIAAARLIGAENIVLAPMAACSTGLWAICAATQLIQTGQCQRVIAGAVEAPITPLTITGFQQMGALANDGLYPFDVNRQGLALGEGGAIFILESRELAKQRKAQTYGNITGFGLTADAFHPNQPHPQGKGAISAIKQCLNRSELAASDIDYIHAHGTGTQLNDRVESLVIQDIFPPTVAVSSTKGATGHTIGASGALGVAFSLMALQQQILPPSVGLTEPEFDLNFVTVPEGKALRNTSRTDKVRQVMCFSFGFGGQNAVIALSHEA
ncbi:beta-ketoacyl-ACP synthase [Mastigocoleus testarum]|uniref:3-oxoacyl-ACP synthase n=1 Tax=Mastigocoleus testarum BC008 TaxID=371196 RepID=A0A0V7ZK72_9CYAN|nr:beta-ketoacyl-ACP synthase [Mastigocoleus testarum]KST64849.1 3-oxoacyl-ACP synthase [Mastigocoleus testarum BC008]